MENIKVNPIKSEVSSEQKMQAPELAGDELLNDEELEVVCGGIGIGPININVDINPVDLAKGIYKAGEGFGKALAGRVWNDDRYC